MQNRSICNDFTTNDRSKRISRCNFNRCVRANLCIQFDFFIFALIRMLQIGKWHRSFFTNGDVVDLLTAMAISEYIQKPRDLFYDIVTSCCPTKTKKYKLYEKAMKVKLKTEPRKSSRRRNTSSTPLTGLWTCYCYFHCLIMYRILNVMLQSYS